MNAAAWNDASRPWFIESGLGLPRMRRTLGGSCSWMMLRMFQWESLTRIWRAPAAIAPSHAALTSPVMSSHERAYSGSPTGFVCARAVMPAMPSISAEMYTFMESPFLLDATAGTYVGGDL